MSEFCELSEALNKNFNTQLDCSLSVGEMIVRSIKKTMSEEDAKKAIKSLRDNFPLLEGLSSES